MEIGVLLDAKEMRFFSLPLSLIRQVIGEEGSQGVHQLITDGLLPLARQLGLWA